VGQGEKESQEVREEEGVNMSAKKTLLQKIIESRTHAIPDNSFSAQNLEAAEVLVAWVKAEVDSAEVVAATDITSTSAVAQKAGTTLRNLYRAGYISISWNKTEPSTEESSDAAEA
jgi:hypothetical protein